MQTDLYETDYFAWTQEQAERLRRMSGDNRIDAAHLAEEVEDLGRSEFYAAARFVELILQHFLKIEVSSGLSDPVRHWRKEIRAFRRRLHQRLTPTLRRKLLDSLQERYETAVDDADRSLDPAVPDLARRVPACCPYTFEQVLDSDWHPAPAAERG